MYPILPVETINQWLLDMIKVGDGKHSRRPGVTIVALANYTGLSEFSLEMYAKRRRRMPVHKQMFLSKILAMVENGQLVFECLKQTGTRKVGRIVDDPRPRLRYKPEFTKDGPRLRATDRPPPIKMLPKFKDALLR